VRGRRFSAIRQAVWNSSNASGVGTCCNGKVNCSAFARLDAVQFMKTGDVGKSAEIERDKKEGRMRRRNKQADVDKID
jgi:hypothetical protein